MNFSAALKAPPKRTNGTVSVFRELSKATKEMRKNLKGKAGGCKTKKKARPQTKEKGNMNRLTTSDISYRRDIVHGLHFQTKYVFFQKSHHCMTCIHCTSLTLPTKAGN